MNGRSCHIEDGAGPISMHFQDHSGTRALVIAHGRIHCLHRGGFLRTRVVARLAGECDDHALLLLDPMGDGLLRFRNGQELVMRCVGPLGMEGALYRLDGSEVLRVGFEPRQHSCGKLVLHEIRVGEEPQLMEAMLVYALLMSQEGLENVVPRTSISRLAPRQAGLKGAHAPLFLHHCNVLISEGRMVSRWRLKKPDWLTSANHPYGSQKVEGPSSSGARER
ncbi:MAG: hypothetical protein WCK39_09780 [Methanomassiliicoccales archaeon]